MNENIFYDRYTVVLFNISNSKKIFKIYHQIDNIFISVKNKGLFKSEDSSLHGLQVIVLFINSLIGQFIRILT